RQIAWLGRQAGRRVQWYDGRETPGGTIAITDLPTTAQQATEPPLLLIIDSAEALGSPDTWLTEQLLGSVPADTVVVLAGREPPPLSWRVDPGWRDLVRVLPLGNLEPAESAELLTTLGVPEARHAAVHAYTRGHPLALVIAADLSAQDDGRLNLAAAPQVVTALLAGLLDAVPGPAHRLALEAAAQVRVITEPLLAALLDVADARTLFDWLCTLSIMEFGPRGLYPQELARDSLNAELRWRHPERHAEIHRRAGAYYQSQFAAAHPGSQPEILADFAYLHRDNPTLGPFLHTIGPGEATVGGLRLRPGAAADHDTIVELVRRHEGDAAAAITGHWLRRQPDGLTVVEDPAGATAGFSLLVSLHEVTAEDCAVDPGVAAVTAHLAGSAPLRSEERATVVRFWLAADDYQGMSPVATILTLHAVRQYLTTPDMAMSLVVYADPEFWSVPAAYVDFARLPGADFSCGDRSFAVFGHDWRVVPTLSWLGLLAARETAEQPLDVQPAAGTPQLRVLDFDEFAKAVRAALRDLGRPDRLRSCALAQSRVVAERAAEGGPAARGAAVQSLILQVAAELAESPRDRRAYRALHHTYLQPAGSQQRAAEMLDLPMTTFRRHLAAGVERLTELLWRCELDGH
ncbi:MAG TPA: hypothetical protein VFO77_15100, partial [Actinoplanes sp.]|nr:hypothetical protein [Actinoplanes sp.]